MVSWNNMVAIFEEKNDEPMTEERLEQLKSEESQVLPEDEERVMKVLVGRSYSRKDLRRKVRMKSAHLTAVLASLEGQNKVKVIRVTNSHGPDTEVISLIRVVDNTPEACRARLERLYKGVHSNVVA